MIRRGDGRLEVYGTLPTGTGFLLMESPRARWTARETWRPRIEVYFIDDAGMEQWAGYIEELAPELRALLLRAWLAEFVEVLRHRPHTAVLILAH